MKSILFENRREDKEGGSANDRLMWGMGSAGGFLKRCNKIGQ